MTGISWKSGNISLDIPFSVSGLSTVMLLANPDSCSMVECGDGAASYIYSLYGRKIEKYESLKNVLITHEHLDHAGGLNSLLWLMEVAGRKSELRVITPEGAGGRVHRMASALKDRLHFSVSFIDITRRNRVELDGLVVSSFRTRHRDSTPANRCGDPVPSAGYVIETGGRSILFSGDTGPVKLLDEKCASADLSVIESTWEEPFECDGLHLTVRQAIEYGSLSKDFILVHPLRDREGGIIF
jgi:ribonuclease BN (tRNA processing enzyme)